MQAAGPCRGSGVMASASWRLFDFETSKLSAMCTDWKGGEGHEQGAGRMRKDRVGGSRTRPAPLASQGGGGSKTLTGRSHRRPLRFALCGRSMWQASKHSVTGDEVSSIYGSTSNLIFVYTCIYPYTFTDICIHSALSLGIPLHVCTCIHASIYLCVCMYTHMRMLICVYIHVGRCIHMYVLELNLSPSGDHGREVDLVKDFIGS